VWLYDQYQNEEEFRDRFVRPLLNRLGFFAVALKHGTQEFGKDFVFSELHRFGGVRHYVAQVKHEDKINQGPKVDGLLSQVRQAFSVPFTLPDSPRERYVSAVYVFNSGAITDNAQTYMMSELRKERYGDNVHFLDGDRLDSLDRWATYQEDRHVRQRLLGLNHQLVLNRAIWLLMHERAQNEEFDEVRGSFLHGIEEFISSPVQTELISLEELTQIWQKARIADNIVNRQRFLAFRVGDTHKQEAAVLAKLTAELIVHAMQVERQIADALTKLNPL